MSEESNEITITRAQLLKRVALFLLAVSVILLIVFCVKFIRFLSIDPTDYEEVDVQVIDIKLMIPMQRFILLLPEIHS